MTNQIKAIIIIIKTFFKFLLLSVTSEQFYYQILHRFKGWGIKFIISCISISVVFLLYKPINIFEKIIYDLQNKPNSEVSELISNIPDLKWDGKILKADETPLNLMNKNIIFIDTNSENVTSRALFVITKNYLQINSKFINKFYKLSYENFLGKEEKIITSDDIKEETINILSKILSSIVIISPLVVLIIFAGVLINMSFIMLFAFILKNFGYLKIDLQSCFRIFIFSKGASIIVESFSIYNHNILYLASILEIWNFSLVIRAIIKSKKENENI